MNLQINLNPRLRLCHEIATIGGLPFVKVLHLMKKPTTGAT